MASAIASSSMLSAVVRTPGGRHVAVGRRGHILVSDNGGQNWRQVSCPVSTDLVAVQFIDARKGWAVGQGGVVLHSTDAGDTWIKQLDGRQAAALMVKHFEALAGDERHAMALDDARRFQEEGPGRPFLDLWFEDDQSGFVVGAFNMIFRTGDGGKSWQVWSDRVPNEGGLHLNAIRGLGSDIYMVGEQGSLWRLDRASQRFVNIPTSYGGSYFGLAGTQGVLVLFGLRGNAFRSEDGGGTWAKLETGVTSGVSAGIVLPGNRLVLVTLGGEILSGPLDGRLAPLKADRPMPYYGVAGSDAGLVLVGGQGARSQKIN
ncbi:MAG: YCF48-related protein [Rhodocyclaceae bacterium]|nr:YCF48-related protein [Rhodocyclaceae bacterium]